MTKFPLLSQTLAVRYNPADCFFYFPEFLQDGVAIHIAIGMLVNLQHDGDAVGGALPGEDSIRDKAAVIGIVDLGGVAGTLECLFGDG